MLITVSILAMVGFSVGCFFLGFYAAHRLRRYLCARGIATCRAYDQEANFGD